MIKNYASTLAALAFILTGIAPAQAATAVVGEAAPDFTLTDTGGNSHSLADYKGKCVVLEWINHTCPFVKKHYDSKNMQKLQKTYTDKGVVWFSICSSAPGKSGYSTAEEAQKLSQDKGTADTAYLLDPEGTVGKLYGAKVTPHMYVIDPGGKLVYQGAIDDIPSTKIADIAKAKNYVAAALDATLAGEPVERSSTQAYGCGVKYAK